jgi:hypothetical protein
MPVRVKVGSFAHYFNRDGARGSAGGSFAAANAGGSFAAASAGGSFASAGGGSFASAGGLEGAADADGAVALHAPAAAASSMTTVGIALLTFSCVAGGPFGIEAAVQAMGAFATCAGLVAAALLWGLPNALITAELSTALPENGGPVVWVRRALGARWAFVNGALLVFQQLTDICLYPTLLAAYCAQLWPQLTPTPIYGIKLAAIGAAFALNVVGVDALTTSSGLLSAVIMLPFVLLPAVAYALGGAAAFDFGAVAPAAAPAGCWANLAVFASTILWNMAGWSEVGCLAGEVGEQAATAFPRGMALACLLITFAYATPVIFGAALEPDVSLWDDGFFVTIAQGVAPWLGTLVIAAAALANMSTLLTSLGAYARTLQAVAREQILPLPLLARNMTRFGTPVPALLVLSASTCALCANLDFSSLVVLDSAFYMIGQASVIISFLRLKYVEPSLTRPFTFPGGLVGAWAAAATTTGLAAFSVYAVASGGALWASYATAGTLAALVVLSLLAPRWMGGGGGVGAADEQPGFLMSADPTLALIADAAEDEENSGRRAAALPLTPRPSHEMTKRAGGTV